MIAYAGKNIPLSPEAPVFFIKPSVVILPGFCDVHVHFREPGFLYKETIATGSRSAAAGGYTCVCTMPNLSPVPDSPDALKVQTDSIRQNGIIEIHPYGTITKGQKGEILSDMQALAPLVAGFSDDGKGVQSEAMMRSAMEECKKLNKILAAHCEDNALLHGGYIHAGRYADAHGHKGICSESEWGPIQRDLALVKETGCAYHVCHVSCKESVALIRQAKKEGLNVTCETGPHYLILSEDDLQEDGRFKMNPPLRSASDREALLEGLLDGTIDMIATDHAPHSAEEKSKGLEKSAFGIVGLETAFPALYTHLVKTKRITLEMLIDKLAFAPRKRFGFSMDEDYSVWDLAQSYTVDPDGFYSMGRATPFAGQTLYGRCLKTVYHGKTVYEYQNK